MPKPALNIVKTASTQTTIPRLFVLEINAGKIHVMNTDGSDRETIVTGCHLPDGIVVDVEAGHIYWTNMGVPSLNDGSVERADLNGKNRKVIVPVGDTHTPKQINLELDQENRVMYWTDRGDPPRGNTVNRASIDNKPAEPEIVVTHLMEGIGIALDVPGDRMFVTDFAGSIYSARLDGSGERNFLYAQGNLTGIAYAEIPKEKRYVANQ